MAAHLGVVGRINNLPNESETFVLVVKMVLSSQPYRSYQGVK